MATPSLLFFTLLLTTLLLPITAVHSSPDPDALRRLITALGVSPIRPPCRIIGVTCSADSATSISLPSRGLSGSLSPSVGLLSSLETLVLRGNSLSGRVPSSISALASSLRVLDLSLNRFDGDVGFLAHLHSLEVLDLSGNRFAGTVPPAVSSFRSLVSLNLSSNPGLVGPFPKLALDAGYFPSRGAAGRRYILAEVPNSTARRAGGADNGSATAPTPSPAAPPSGDQYRHKKRKVWSWIVGFIVGAVVGVVSGVISSVFLRLVVDCFRGRFRNPAGVQIFSSVISAEDVEFLKKEEEVAKLEVIGHGGCGEVYRSVTRGARPKVIAIKKIKKVSANETTAEVVDEESRMLDKFMRQLQSEIKTVGHIRHRNLLPLLAHVPRSTCNYLVYEYMKNGSLQDAMKKDRRYGVNGGGVGGDETPSPPFHLGWETRFKIAEGIAAGLEYLHWQHRPRIIHRDLKPGNILLDDDFEARIADFGFAKAMPDAKTHMTSSHIAGTVGYIAPEYHQTLKFTDKCDVYSFGVILAGLALGKAPSDAYFQDTEEMSLVRWLRNVMKAGEETAREVVDERLRGSGHEEEMVLVLKIACFCTADDPRERPSSKEVRCMLQQIKARGLLQPLPAAAEQL